MRRERIWGEAAFDWHGHLVGCSTGRGVPHALYFLSPMCGAAIPSMPMHLHGDGVPNTSTPTVKIEAKTAKYQQVKIPLYHLDTLNAHAP
jgi:hypothetical protein